MALTVAQVKTKVGQELQDPSAVYYTGTIILDRINEAQRVFARETRLLRDSTALNVVGGQAEYDLSTISPGVLEVLAVACPQSAAITSPIALRYMTWEELEAQDTLWRTRTGNPRAYMRYQEGPLLLRLYPTPDTSYSALAGAPSVSYDGLYGIPLGVTGITDATYTSLYGLTTSTGIIYGGLTIDYIADSTDVSADGDTLTLPPHYHEAVFYYVCARLCELSVPIQQQEKAQGYWAKWAEFIAEGKGYAAGGFQSKPPRSVSVREF